MATCYAWALSRSDAVLRLLLGPKRKDSGAGDHCSRRNPYPDSRRLKMRPQLSCALLNATAK